MHRSEGTTWRWTRACVLTTLALTTGAVGHVLAGGRLPSLPTLLLLFAVCLVAVASLLGRPASTLRVVALTVGGQTFVHLGLTMAAGHAGDHPAGPSRATGLPLPLPVPQQGPGRSTGSLFEQYVAARPHVPMSPAGPVETGLPDAVQHLLADLTGANAPMMAAHLLAAALVGLWLAGGERALWTLLAMTAAVVLPALFGVLAAFRPAPAGPAPASTLRDRSDRPLPHLQVLARSVVRRGPPLLVG